MRRRAQARVCTSEPADTNDLSISGAADPPDFSSPATAEPALTHTAAALNFPLALRAGRSHSAGALLHDRAYL